MKMLSGSLSDQIKLEIGYKTEDPRICKNCKHYEKKRDATAYGGSDPVCVIVGEVGYFDVWEDATCNKFSRKS